MAEEITWSEWFEIQKAPELFDYVHIVARLKDSEEFESYEFLYMGEKSQPPKKLIDWYYAGATLEKWRKRIIADLTETEQENEVMA